MNKKSFSIGLIVGGLLGIIPGFGLGVYFLPIIIADEGADEIVISQAMDAAERRDGEGGESIDSDQETR